MESDTLLAILMNAAPSLAKPVSKAIKKCFDYLEVDGRGLEEPPLSPRDEIRKSGPLETAELSYGAINTGRAQRVIKLAQTRPRSNIYDIKDENLRHAALALESEDRAYTEFFNAWRSGSPTAIDDLYRSRAVNLFIRKMWPGYSIIDGDNTCVTIY